MNRKGKLFVVAAPSGAGKTTIVKHIRKTFPELVFSVSATTRKKRDIETHGVDYFFLTEDEFKKKRDDNEFVEWEKFYGYYYGTLKSFIDDNLTNGKSVIFDIDVKGAVSIKKVYPEAILVFIAPPSKEDLKQRLISRNTETDEDLQKRIERSEMELEYKDKFDVVVINDVLEKAKKEVEELIEKEYK